MLVLVHFVFSGLLMTIVKSSAPDCGIRNQFRGYCFSFDYCTKWSCGGEKCGSFPRSSELLKIRETRIIPQCAVTNSPTLKCISGIYSNIQVLASGAFANLPNLESIILPYNSIRVLHHGTFYNVNVQLLDLSFNKIIYISEGAFDGITGLKYLNLSKNELGTLPVEYLPIGLVQINLSHNFLERIALNGAKRPDLTNVDLSYNNLKNIALSFDKTLEDLDLTHNDLKDIDFYDINDCDNLKIPSNLFSAVPQFLEYSKIRRVALHPNPWKCDELRKLWLHLQNNNIEEVTPENPESSPLCSIDSSPQLSLLKNSNLECDSDNHCKDNMLCRAHKCWDPCNIVCESTNICFVENHEVECLCAGTQKKNPRKVLSPCYDVECFEDRDCTRGRICGANNTCIIIPHFVRPVLDTAVIPIQNFEGGYGGYREPGGEPMPDTPWWFTEIPKLSPVNVISQK